jgi:hypothetical protein
MTIPSEHRPHLMTPLPLRLPQCQRRLWHTLAHPCLKHPTHMTRVRLREWPTPRRYEIFIRNHHGRFSNPTLDVHIQRAQVGTSLLRNPHKLFFKFFPLLLHGPLLPSPAHVPKHPSRCIASPLGHLCGAT